MTRAHEVPAAIQWHEGMLLAPQHFQQLALRSEKLLHYHAGILSAFHYGVVRVRFDPTLVLEGTVRVLELEALLPDGLVVSYKKGDEATDLQIDVRPQTDAAKQEPLLVHLAVPGERPPGQKAEGDLGRFASLEGEPIADENSGERPLRIPRLRPRLRLLAGATPPARFTSMPICALRYRSGSFALSDYIEPMLQVPVDSPLGQLCGRVSQRVREKSLYLVETIRSPALTTKASVIEEHKRLLSYLIAGLPAFEALLRSGGAHPLQLYTALCGVAGPIAAVGQQLVPPVFPNYDHNNLRRCFEEVKDFVFRTMDEGISEAFTAIPFTWESGTYNLKIEREWTERVLVLGVQGTPGATDQQILDWVNTSLMGAESKYRMLRERRLLGTGREPIDKYEGLVATRGMLLFKLKVDPDFIVPNEVLMLGNASEKNRPAEVFLYVSNKG